MHYYRLLLFLFLFTTRGFFSHGQPTLVFHNLTTKDGLSENTIRCIIEDTKGYMWFGTEDGLNRYDGYEFRQFKNAHDNIYSLSSGQTKSLFIDKKKNLWIATRDGLNLFDKESEKFYNYQNSDYLCFKNLSGDFDMITEDSKGNLWVSSTEDGIFKISDLNKPAVQFTSPYTGYASIITCIALENDNSLLIGTLDGLFKFDIATSSFIDLRHDYGKGYQVKNIFIDKNKNKILLATTDGLKIIQQNGKLTEYRSNLNNPFEIMGNNVTEVIKYKDGNYILAIDGFGIDYFNDATEKFFHYTSDNQSQLSANNISSLYLDKKEDLWVGTFMNGINFSNLTTNIFILNKNNSGMENTIQKGIITDFLTDRNGDLWITTDGGGIYRKKKASKKLINYTKENTKGLTSDAVLSATEDMNGTLYFTTYGGGLCQFDYDKNNFSSYTKSKVGAKFLCDDKLGASILAYDKIFVAGFGTGISYFDIKENRWRKFTYNKDTPNGLPADWIHCFYLDRDNNLWLGTFNGLSKFNPYTETFVTFRFGVGKEANERNFILDIVEDSKGKLWLATSGAGLLLFDKNSHEFQVFTTKNGLSDNNIRSLIEDDNHYLWLATNNGLTRLSTLDYKTRSYQLKDGVPASSFFIHSKYKDENGRLYFGSNNGYLIVNPNLIKLNTLPPPVVFNRLKIFNEEITHKQPNSPLQKCINETNYINLSYTQTSLTFEFSALNYNNSQNNQYAYFLEGFDEHWVMAGTQRSATYTNLNPGNYTFKVKACNNDGIWNEVGEEIYIKINPPFYKTWWFYSLVVVLASITLYALHLWRTRLIKQENIKLEEIVKTRTEELKNANEQLEAFVYRASHDIKGPLRSIIGLTTIGQKESVNDEAKEYFDHILKSTKKLDNLLMDLLEVTKVKQASLQLEAIDFKELIAEASERFNNLEEYTKITIQTDIKEESKFYSDKKMIFSVIQNIIENAIKYSDPNKKDSYLMISGKISSKKAQIEFKDNGIGIPDEMQSKVFDMFFKTTHNINSTGLGLYLVKTTIEKLQGTISLESKTTIGTSFTITLNEIHSTGISSKPTNR